ncbi:MAG: hypothetical protein WCF26_18375 [Candidatus Sulfotelmatobacter sp.]
MTGSAAPRRPLPVIDRSRRRESSGILRVSLGLGLISLLATEFMHSLLVPYLGRRWERLSAESVSGAVVALLTFKLMQIANRRREAALLRMQVISEMNHHIRDALAVISLSIEPLENRQCIGVISQSVDHIEWALREILLRNKPLPEDRQPAYFPSRARNENKRAR